MGGDKRIVGTSEAPAAVGPYSQAVEAGGFIFCSGQIPLDPETGEIVTDSVGEATKRCLLNLQAVLRAAGADFSDVVQVTVYLADLRRFEEMNQTYARFFTDDPPARVTVGVAALPRGASVEIAAVAARGSCGQAPPA